ncbi:MAG: aldose epimerase family protein [Lachnospiraceae bacterium]|jgi:aldose 1-epimerase|nr:galactose mutarotase [Lachnospiraceae bacterium]
MSVTKVDFGEAGGRRANLFLIENAGITLKVTDFGACLAGLIVPDKDGNKADVVAGYGDVGGYTDNSCFLGATIGPSANRIAGAKLTIDGKTYHMAVNENENNLHTDFAGGSHKRFWDSEVLGDGVKFSLSLEDGEYGLPGKRLMQITFTVTDAGGVRLHYHCTSDKKTLFNMTNHAYYNLAGESSGKMEDQVLQLFADSYCPDRPDSIPTGEIASVEGTPLDFRTAKPIGQDINADFEQLHLVGGFDHNFVIRGWNGDGSLKQAASAYDPKSGRAMDVFTTLPGVQFYSGNFMKEKNGKSGKDYVPRDAFCLETQYFPDSVNHENFVHPIFGAGEDYDSVTEYRFCNR